MFFCNKNVCLSPPNLILFLLAIHHLPPLPPFVFLSSSSLLCNIFCFALLYNVLRFSVCLDLAVCLLYILRIARRRPSQKIYSTYPSFPATRPRDVPLDVKK